MTQRQRPFTLLLSAALTAILALPAAAQLNENCVVSILNRTAQVREDGSWIIPNVPANLGSVRARATCVENGTTRVGQSAFFTVPRSGIINAVEIDFGTAAQTPARLEIAASRAALPNLGDTEQLRATAVFPGGSTVDVSVDPGIGYTTSNSGVATVSPAGLITAVAPGVAIISASYDGTLALFRIAVAGAVDSDGDGMPDDYERQNGFDPGNPADASADADGDGLTNLQEFQLGTDPRVIDTDGDGISDGLESQSGSDPLNPGSYDLSRALRSLVVTPIAVDLRGNPLFGDVSRQLTVTGTLLDGRTIDLTSTTRGTSYSSSDLLVCNFGTTDGLLFAGRNGTATITVRVAGFTTLVPVSVQSFSPVGRGIVRIPGYANNVKVLGDYAYVAAGAAGLQVVSIAAPNAPVIVNALGTYGNANDLRIVGNRIFIADGYAGLYIASIEDPAFPYTMGSVDTIGDAQDVWVDGNYAYVADGGAGLQIIDVADPFRPLRLSRVPTTGRAKGVSVSNGYAVVVTGDQANELIVVDVRNPLQPVVAGKVTVPGEPKDVVARGTYAYIAAYTGGLQIVDFAIPSAPRLTGAVPDTFVPRDVALLGDTTAVLAEQLFPNAIPFVDVGNPAAPSFRNIIDLRSLGDYAETGLDLDSAYVYVTAENWAVWIDTGTRGNTALLIAQYTPVDDPASTFPTARILSPADGAELVAGTKVLIEVEAKDDERVAAVATYVDGAQTAFTRTPPFVTELTVPTGVSSLTLTATAFDFASRPGSSPPVTVRVIADPLTTLTGIVNGPNGTAQPGVRVELVDRDQETVTDATGRYTFTGLSTIDGAYEIYADVRLGSDDYDGRVKAILPVRGGVTTVPDLQLGRVTPVVAIFAPPYGTTLVGGTTATIILDVSSFYATDRFAVTLDGVVAATSNGSVLNVPVPNRAGTLRIGATATDVMDHTGTAEEIVVEITPDPLTRVEGTVVNASGNPVAGATVTVLDFTVTTDAAGRYAIPNVPTVRGDLVARASAMVDGDEILGTSEELPPTPGGVTYLDVTVRGFPVGKIAEYALGGYGNGVDAQGSRVYVAGGLTGLSIFDVANPALPQLLGQVGFLSMPTDVKVTGNIAWVAAAYPRAVDVSDPSAPRVIGTLPAVPASKLEIAGSMLLAMGPDKIAMIDAGKPEAPRVLNTLGGFKLPPRSMVMAGRVAIVTEHSFPNFATNTYLTDVHVIDVSRRDVMTRLGRVTISTPAMVHDVAVAGTRAYLTMTGNQFGTAGTSSGMPIIDFSNNAAPVLVTTYTQTNFHPLAITAHGNVLVVGGGTGSGTGNVDRLYVLNAAVHPPQRLTSFDPGANAHTAVAVSGNYLYALAGGNTSNSWMPGNINPNILVTSRYRMTSDRNGVKPVATFTRPAQGDQIVEGSFITIEAAATDDVAVSSFTITANGVKLQTVNGESARLNYRVPDGITTLALRATATDFGGNVADTTVSYSVASDPRTTVSGVVRTTNGVALPNATVTVGALTTTTSATGAYSFANVTTTDPVVARVAATVGGEDLRGVSTPVPPVASNVTVMPDLIAAPRPAGPITSISIPGFARAVDVKGKLAYVVNGSSVYARSQLQIIDFSDAEAPQVVGGLIVPHVPQDVCVWGNYAYIAGGSTGVLIVDVSDPTMPRSIRSINLGNSVQAVAASGTTLYVTTLIGRLVIFDVSNPSNPVTLSDTRLPGSGSALELAGRYALVTGGQGNNNEGTFNVVDVSDPRKPLLQSQFSFVPSLTFTGSGASIAVRGSTAYVATGSGTHVIDFGNPAAPRVTRTYSGSSTFRLAARGTHLIATINTPNTISKPSLGLFDLTSATFTPTLYDFNSTQVWSPVGVALSGDLALITSSQGVFGESRTFIAKYPAVVDRAGVPPVVRILMPATGDRVTEADHIPVEVTATDDVGVQQVSILANGAGTGPLSLAPYQTFVRVPTGVGTLTLSAIATDLEGNAGTASDVVLQVRPDPLTTVSGRVVDVTGTGIANATVDLRGLRTTTDASGSYTLANVASVPNAIMASAWGRVNNLFANGSAQAVAGANGFTTMPNIVLRPPNVGPLQSFPIPAAANAIAVHGTNAFVALGSSGLMILDLTNPLQPVHLTTMSLRSNSIASDLAFSGNMAYVAGGPFEGLHVVDITNPAQPVLRGSLRTGSVYHVAVSGTTVYIADASDTGGLDVVDASDPAAPVLVGTALNNRWAADVAMAGSYVVVFHTSTFQSSTDPRISVIDVSNPASPLQIGSVAVPGLAGSSLVVRGNSVMLVGGTEIQMFDISNPAVPVFTGRFTPTQLNGLAMADSGTHLLHVGIGNSGGPHLIEVYNAVALSNLTKALNIQYSGTPSNFYGQSVALMNEFVISTGTPTAGFPRQTGVSHVYIGKWRN